MYKSGNKLQIKMTATPGSYPQKHFKDKPCKFCGNMFSPKAPSHLYCSQDCTDKGWSDNYLQKTYGLSQKEYDDLEKAQEGKCAVCRGEGFKMREHHFKTLVVDHCHTTNKVRGLLCHNCNRALGLLKDNLNTLNNAIKYLST